MADMTFKANLLPNSQSFGYSLGSNENRWKIYGDQHQEFDYLEANSEYTIPSYIIKLINDGYKSGWFGCMNASGKGCPTSTGDLWYNIHWEKTKIGNRIYLEASPYGVNKLYKGSCWANNETSMPVWEEMATEASIGSHYVTLDTAQTISGGKTFSSPIYFSTGAGVTRAILAYDANNLGYGITYKEGNPDVITFSASGNANDITNADLSINGLGDGKVSIRGKEILHTGNYTTILDDRYVNVTGDTMTGALYINNTTDVGLNQNGALIIGNKTGYNIGIDGDEIEARNNSAASTLYLNNDGGAVQTKWFQVINNSSNNANDAMVYLENQSNNDWAQKILLSTYNYGLYISGTGTNLLKVGDNNTLYIGNGDAQVNGSILKITNNSNTLSIGSQNSTYTHIYNSANIPFIFNKDVNVTDKHWLGSTSYPWGGLRLGGTSPSIQYQGSKANKDMIVMIDNTSDANGNGIRIGGGGLVIIGGGESASTLQSNLGYTGGSEATVIGSDGAIYFYPGQDSYDASARLTMTASRFCAGVDGNTTREAQVQVASGGGSLYLWSPASTTSDRGLYAPAHGSGGAKHVIRVSADNRVYFSDSYNDTPTALAYSQPGLAASAITWLTCWNGYELRAISKAEMANAVDSAHKWVRLAGDTMTGQLNNTFGGSSTARHYENVAFYENNASSYTGTIKIKLPNTTSNMVMMVLKIIIFDYNSNSGCELLVSGYTYNDKKWYNAAASPQGTFTKGIRLAYDGTNFCVLLGTTSSTWNYSKIILADVYSGYNAQPATGYAISLITSESGYTISQTLTSLLRADKVWGAVWNDYAEMRRVDESIEPGRCVCEVGNGEMILSTKRLERGCKIISDTYGFNIGETDECKTPIAVSGRVLVYLYEGREYAKSHIGWPVCSGPNGTVSIMSEEEEIRYSSRIIGTISEIPEYETWGTGNVQVNDRIWIYVR